MRYLRLSEILEDVTDEETIEFDRMLFNGGENHIKLIGSIPEQVTIEAQLKNSNYVMELLLATDALRRAGAQEITLVAPYIPYGRQDRVMVPGEPLSIRVFANLINAQNYKAVYTLDNHSSVTTALIDRCIEIDNTRLMKELHDEVLYAVSFWRSDDDLNLTLISPDAGGEKRTFSVAQKCELEVFYASKIRDVRTGAIIETRFNGPNLKGTTCLIVDDICDGGRTFLELAKVLTGKFADFVYLYVSHGIFNQGLYQLKEHFDGIYSTNIWRRDKEVTNNVWILPLRKEDIK